MYFLNKIFPSSSKKADLGQTKNFKWLPNHELYETMYSNTIESLLDTCRLVHFKAFLENKSFYRIDEEYSVKREGPGKPPYNLTLSSDYPLVDMCVKGGGTKKTAALKFRVLCPSGDKVAKRKIIQKLQLKAETHYAQVLKTLAQDNGR